MSLKLVDLLKFETSKYKDYKRNFRHSILEACNMNLGRDYILDRESYWRDILMTRSYDYGN